MDFLLTVVIMLSGDTPDPKRAFPMTSIEVCLESAKDWLAQDLKEVGPNVIGLVASCAERQKPGHDS